jgi:hypothetical protein
MNQDSNNKEVKPLKGTSAIRSREIKLRPFLIDTFNSTAERLQLMHINGRNSYLTDNSVLPLENRSFNAVYRNNRCLSHKKKLKQANAVFCVKSAV